LEELLIKGSSQGWLIAALRSSKKTASKDSIKALESLFWVSLPTELSISGKINDI
jgi:hypothetical protein